MKKTFIILALLSISFAAHAHDSDIGLIIKAGSTLSGDHSNISSLMLTVQADDCQHCITGTYVHLDNKGFDGKRKNNGVGVDYLYKIPNPASQWYYITGGAYLFSGEINEDAVDGFSYHVGAGMDLNGFVLAVDVFGQPFGKNVKWSPVTLFSAGWHF